MEALLNSIRSNFGQSSPAPNSASLVEDDGYDVLEKERAVEFFQNKEWNVILEHLQKGNAYHYLEEWSVLSISALSYYARAYLEYFVEALSKEEPDEEFIFFFLGELYQVIYIHKGSPFSLVQTEVIKNIVQHAAQKSNVQGFYEYFSKEIKEYGKKFLGELQKYNG